MVSLRCSSVAVAMVSLIACHTTQAEGDDGAARAQTIAGGRGFPAERDLAILLPSQSDLGGRLAELGIEVLEVPSDTLLDVEVAAAAIAERCNVPAAGQRLVERLRRLTSQ